MVTIKSPQRDSGQCLVNVWLMFGYVKLSCSKS